jgi:hypothetical protein
MLTLTTLKNHIMKKIFTTLFMVLSVYTLTKAQTKNEFSVGAGLNNTTVISSNQTAPYKLGFNISVANDFYFSDKWSLKVKASYDQKGWASGLLTTPTATYGSVDYRLKYVTIPVMANWHFGKTKNWYLNFGPYIGFLLDATADVPNFGPFDVKSSFKGSDAGLDIGIGIKIPTSKTSNFYIEYDGQGGVTNIYSTSGNTAQNIRGSFNIGLTFK